MPKTVAGFRNGIWTKVHMIGVDTEDQQKEIDDLKVDVGGLKKDSFRIKAVGSIFITGVTTVLAFGSRIKTWLFN